MSVEERLQNASAAYQKLQNELSACVEARQRLDTQLTETSLVKKEFEGLKPENTVYKLIGPVLVEQDQSEAKANVDKRLDFIRGELKRTDSQIEEINNKSDKAREEIIKIQTAHQADLQKEGTGTPISVN